jgi:hypothetical protein
MKRGDFSAISQAIYNPASSRRDPATNQIVRDPFAGNIIPTSQFDSAAVKAMAYIPDPTQNVVLNNLPTSTGTNLHKYRNVNRVDWIIGQKDTMSGSYMFDHTNQIGVDAYNKISQAASPLLSGFGFRFFTQVLNIHEQHTVTPTFFVSNRFVYRPRYIERVNPAVDPAKQWATTLGIKNFAGARLPAELGGDLGFPSYAFTGYTARPWRSSLSGEADQGSILDLDLTYVKGSH